MKIPFRWPFEGEPFDYAADDDYIDALEYAKKFTPQDGLSYDWVYDYGIYHYERMMQSRDLNDGKADAIINCFGAFTGLMTVVMAYIGQSAHWPIAVAGVPSFVLAVCAILKASSARSPMDVPVPADIRTAIEYGEFFDSDEKGKASFVAQFNSAAKGMKAVCQEKSRRVTFATRCLVWAVVCLVFPLFTGVVQGIVQR